MPKYTLFLTVISNLTVLNRPAIMCTRSFYISFHIFIWQEDRSISASLDTHGILVTILQYQQVCCQKKHMVIWELPGCVTAFEPCHHLLILMFCLNHIGILPNPSNQYEMRQNTPSLFFNLFLSQSIKINSKGSCFSPRGQKSIQVLDFPPENMLLLLKGRLYVSY